VVEVDAGRVIIIKGCIRLEIKRSCIDYLLGLSKSLCYMPGFGFRPSFTFVVCLNGESIFNPQSLHTERLYPSNTASKCSTHKSIIGNFS